jgi:hypothetical protein
MPRAGRISRTVRPVRDNTELVLPASLARAATARISVQSTQLGFVAPFVVLVSIARILDANSSYKAFSGNSVDFVHISIRSYYFYTKFCITNGSKLYSFLQSLYLLNV